MNFRSIRWRLPLTYAGIACLTALALGGVLLLVLQEYYQEREQAYLERNAAALSEAVAPLIVLDQPPDDLELHVGLLAFLAQTRVRLFAANGWVLADSGEPRGRTPIFVASGLPGTALVEPAALQKPPSAGVESAGRPEPQPGDAAGGGTPPIIPGKMPEHFDRLILNLPAGKGPEQFPLGVAPEKLRIIFAPSEERMAAPPGDFFTAPAQLITVIPAAATMYGFDLEGEPFSDERSTQVYRQPILLADGRPVGTIELSDGPAYGREIVRSVALVWAGAGLTAVSIAGLAGWWISRRISAPLLSLAEVTRRMADGDLSVRGEVRSEDEIGLLAGAFNEMADRVGETVAVLRRFASDAAHELNTPLTALRTNLELIASSRDPGGEQGLAGGALAQVLRLETLTNDLLDLSRIESRWSDLPLEPVDLTGLVRAAAEPYASIAEQGETCFLLDLPDEPVIVQGRPAHLQRAVGNLLDNAIKFIQPGGQVQVGVRVESRAAQVWVEDTGLGIPAEDLPHLFSRFHRGRNALDRPGSGLGLAIVKEIVDQHGGEIQVESRPGWTRFTLSLFRR